MKNNSTGIFKNNKAVHNGGSAFLEINFSVYFEEHCKVTFEMNTAEDGTGGAISSNTNSVVEFNNNCVVMFYNNIATQGEALNLYSYSFNAFQGSGANSTVIFDNNKATQNGGAIHLQKNSAVMFRGTQRVEFCSNEVYEELRGLFGGHVWFK